MVKPSEHDEEGHLTFGSDGQSLPGLCHCALNEAHAADPVTPIDWRAAGWSPPDWEAAGLRPEDAEDLPVPWRNDEEARRRSDATYKDPEYLRNKAVVRHRSGGRCEFTEGGQRCNSPREVWCDHIVPITKGGTHSLENLQDLCGYHHRRKTAREGGGYRNQHPREDPPLQQRTVW